MDKAKGATDADAWGERVGGVRVHGRRAPTNGGERRQEATGGAPRRPEGHQPWPLWFRVRPRAAARWGEAELDAAREPSLGATAARLLSSRPTRSTSSLTGVPP